MRRDILILAGLFVALAALIALGPARNVSAPGTSATSHASGDGGALALFRWLDAVGYDVGRIEYAEFAPDPDADMLIVLGPTERYSREEAAAVADWVAAGGTLLVAEERAGAFGMSANLLDAFDLAVIRPGGADAQPASVPVLQPALGAPLAITLEAATGAAINTERADVARLAGDEKRPVLVGLQHGEGYVFASSTVYPFTNAGIGQADNAAMVLNLLRRVPAAGRVVFDEFHHGFQGEASLRTLLLGTPWGWATLYAAVVGAAYLALTGRRFGRPAPLGAEADRRSSAEYLESLAGLLRRAGKADYLQGHFRSAFKRRLARAYGLNPDLDDAAYLEALADMNPAQARAAADVLARLAQAGADEQAILRAVAEADRVAESR
jgi:hypothetical protein